MRKLLIVIILASLFISCTSKKKKAKDLLVKATEHYKKDDYGNAAKEVDLAMQLDSSNYDISILKAKIKSAVNLNEEAISILKKVAKENFKVDTINFFIGEFYFDIGSYYTHQKVDNEKSKDAFKNSIKYYELCTVKNPLYFGAYIGKAHALHNVEKYDEALITLNNAIIFFPDSMTLIFSRGVEKGYLGDNSGAMIDLDKAIISNRLDSIDMASAYRWRGNIFYEKDSIDNAIQDLTKAVIFNPKDELAFATRGGFYKDKGLKDKACDDYRKAADLGLVVIYETIKDYCEK